MKTKTIFKMLALAMLMPAMLLTTACSNEDDALNTENTAKKGYILPVTVNVTRQGNGGTTRASYNEGTKKLEFSAGDKLFVKGSYHEGDYNFAGTLTWVSDGTFSGTITTQTEWTGTTEELLSADGGASATLLPAGYGEYGYLSIADGGTYEAYLSRNSNKAFATSKATAVEQFSYEYDNDYSSGFELIPSNAILNFTINGLDASTEVDVSFSYPNYPDPIVVSGKVTTDGDGTATFAIGMIYGINLKDCTLTVDGNAITLPANKEVEAGHIYNISRSVTPAPTARALAEATTDDIGKIAGADGNIYDSKDAAEAAGTTAVAMIAYVGSDAETSTTYNHGLALALSDVSSTQTWCSQTASTCLTTQYSSESAAKADMAGLANTDALVGHDSHTHAAASAARNYNSGTHPTGTSAWFLPSAGQWDKMATAASGYNNLGLQSYVYWSSSEANAYYAWKFLSDDGSWRGLDKDKDRLVRACLAF